MKQLIIDFQTLNLPAPFAHEYHLDIRLANKINVTYQIKYLDREDMIEDDYEEGFSDQEDFSWEGQLNSKWKSSILKIAEEITDPTEEIADHPQTELVVTTNEHGQTEKQHFYDDETIQYQVQEVIQAIYETAKKEHPLSFFVLRIENGRKETLTFEMSFESRAIQLTQGDRIINVPWKQGSGFAELIYQPSYEIDAAKPKGNGIHISFDGSHWFSARLLEKENAIPQFEKHITNALNDFGIN